MRLMISTCVLALPSVLALTGCAATNPQTPIPSSVFVDLASLPEWKAAHEAFVTCSGQKVKLPAWISFRRVPNPITYGGYAAGDGETYIEFGAMRLTVTASPACPLTFAPPPGSDSSVQDNDRAMSRAGIKYWAVTPVNKADQDGEWVYPGPDQLKTRASAGKVQTVQLDFPSR